MRIGDVTRRTGVTARMLRYYETQGLLVPARHLNGYRDYSDRDLQQVVTIRDLSASGVPTRFIKIILDRQADNTAWTESCDETLAAMIHDQIAALDSKIACLSLSRDSLAGLLSAHQG